MRTRSHLRCLPKNHLRYPKNTIYVYGACHEFPFAAGIRSVRSELCVESPDQEGIKLRQERPVDGYHHQSI